MSKIDWTDRSRIPSTSSRDAEGRPICVWCDKRLRFHMGYGYNGMGHFCGMRCAAEWGDRKVEGTSASAPEDRL